MVYQTMQSPHDEEDGLLHETNTGTKNNWNIWSIVNALLWTVTTCLLIYSLTNRIPSPNKDISNKIKNIEQAVGSVDIGATVLNALNADVKNLENKAVHIERKDKHNVREYKDNLPEYYFLDDFGLRVMYADVLGKFHNADLLSENLSFEIDGFIVSDVHVEALNTNTEQAMIKTPIKDPELFLLDCEACYEDLKNQEPIANCECRILTAKSQASEAAVGATKVEYQGKKYTVSNAAKMEWDKCPGKADPADCQSFVIRMYGNREHGDDCLAGLNSVDTPDGQKLIQELKINEYIKTGQSADGSPIYDRVVYLVNKGASRHIKLEVEDGSFVTLTPNHNVITQNGENASFKATLDDSLLHEDGTFKKIVSIEKDIIDDTYALRTTAFNGLIWTNGLYASENSVKDMSFFRKGYNFVVMKIFIQLPYLASFIHHHPHIGVYIDVLILIMVVSMISYGLRQKERSLKME